MLGMICLESSGLGIEHDLNDLTCFSQVLSREVLTGNPVGISLSCIATEVLAIWNTSTRLLYLALSHRHPFILD